MHIVHNHCVLVIRATWDRLDKLSLSGRLCDAHTHKLRESPDAGNLYFLFPLCYRSFGLPKKWFVLFDQVEITFSCSSSCILWGAIFLCLAPFQTQIKASNLKLLIWKLSNWENFGRAVKDRETRPNSRWTAEWWICSITNNAIIFLMDLFLVFHLACCEVVETNCLRNFGRI